MNRVRDYIQFAVCFAGIGYIVLWPFTAHDDAIAAFGASLICGGNFMADAFCRLPHPLTLSPGLHLIGLFSALAVVARCVLLRLARLRPARRASPVAAAVVLRPRMSPALTERPRPVKPRRQFGLRGVSQ
jgi:hypothetical protein